MIELLQALMNPGTVVTYAPRFEVYVKGSPLGDDVSRDVLSVSVVLDTEATSSFSLMVNNSHDLLMALPKPPGGPRFPTKYTDTAVFDVGQRVTVAMGYGHFIYPMMQGTITSLTPSFPASGASTLSVSGEDATIAMRDRKPSSADVTMQPPAGSEEGVSDRELMTLLADRAGLAIDVLGGGDVDVKYRQLVHDTDDLSLLQNRARRIGYDAFVRTDVSGRTALRVVKRSRMIQSLGGQLFPLVWGQNLIDFSPVINASRQVPQITVRSWDKDNKQAIEYTADAASLGLGDRSGPSAARMVHPDKHEVLVDYSIESLQEAQLVAESALQARADGFVTGTATCVGNPFMRQGDGVQLGGLGRRFDGLYVIQQVTHAISGSGYTTKLKLRKPEDGGTVPLSQATGGPS